MADQYGNPTHQTVMTGGQTNQHGNLVPQTGGKGACDVGAGTGMLGGEHQKQHDQQSGVLQRSGSSSSEDDEQGGRRKKGIKDKIKERIPGVGRKDEPCVGRKEEPCVGRKDEQKHTSATTTPGQGQQPKGVMEKIKEKLPGGH